MPRHRGMARFLTFGRAMSGWTVAVGKGLGIRVFPTGIKEQDVETPAIFWVTILWMVAWGVIGSIVLRRRYYACDLDTSNASFVGAMSGAALGPIGVGLLWARTPELSGRIIV